MYLFELKYIINDNIKTNGQREITGAKLNEVLNDMADFADEQGRLVIIDATIGEALTDNDYTVINEAINNGKLVALRIETSGEILPVVCRLSKKKSGDIFLFSSDLVTERSDSSYYYFVTVPLREPLQMSKVIISNLQVSNVNS